MHHDAARLAAAYEALPYPSGVFPQASPDRLAVVAAIHGLAPAPMAHARVLELGGGDGLNALAIACAYPHAQVRSLDLSGPAAARGAALAAAAGLGNARIEQADIVAVADTLDGHYDYVIAHGVYAWVPPPVQAALLRLIGRVLAPQGVAFVSYNALPGGYLRLMMRDMMLHAVAGVPEGAARVRAAHAFYRALAESESDGSALRTALREEAAITARKSENFLAHDEGTDAYLPQALATVAAAAAQAGLGYLNDAQRHVLADGFVAPSLPMLDEAGIVARAQAADHSRLEFFRESLFVRAEARPQRRLDPMHAAALWLSFPGKRVAAAELQLGTTRFSVDDPRLCDLLERAGTLYPARIALAAEGLDPAQLGGLLTIMERGLIDLHATALPAATTIGPRPRASPLARAQLAGGEEVVCRLDGRRVRIAEASAHAFLALLDGSRDPATLRRDWAASPYGAEEDADTALAMLARLALLMPEG